jgi:hypothetical protein
MGYSMVTPRYHYVEWRYWDNVKKVAGGLAAVELYDRQADPDENTNIAEFKENGQVVERLSRQLRRGWRSAVPEEHAASVDDTNEAKSGTPQGVPIK